MSFSKFLDPKNDFAFKRIFGTERNKYIIIPFLNDILEFKDDVKIKDVQFLKTAQDPEIASRKQSIVDILCIDDDGRQHIVEMQMASTKGFIKRAQYYAAKAYISQMDKGEKYEGLKEIIFLAIADFIMFPEKDEYKSDHVILDRKTNHHDLKDFSFTFLELPKFTKTQDELTSMVEKCAYFFKNATTVNEKDLDKIVNSDLVLKRAFDELNVYSWTEEELRTYEAEKKIQLDNEAALEAALDGAHDKGKKEGLSEGKKEGLKEGKEKGLQEGKKKGLQEGKKEAQTNMAKSMIKEGMNIDIIAKITGLSKSAVENLSRSTL